MRYKCKKSVMIKNPVNMTPPKKTNKSSITDTKEMEIHELSHIEFRIILLRSSVNYKNTQRIK